MWSDDDLTTAKPTRRHYGRHGVTRHNAGGPTFTNPSLFSMGSVPANHLTSRLSPLPNGGKIKKKGGVRLSFELTHFLAAT